MSRDLAGDVERLMKAGNSYVKKKVKNFWEDELEINLDNHFMIRNTIVNKNKYIN